MTDAVWIIVSRKGIQRIAKGPTRAWQRRNLNIPRPRLAQGEYAVLVKVDVPDSAFKPIRLPTAVITLVAPTVDVQVQTPPPPDGDTE